ncbi:hypothetical protein SAMN04488498_101393 [Mesorhizobium albiziae]|uniref:Uncharacterized protein n=1 Tax=Neomesorhizobium albiziae TaxID=335020 RepID=A0A1I3VDR6_9HYPH|nr:hypothetical protein [Mesorhizobium albiziae]GLS28851.1 hypothetical protein GCM10007937_05580 [Mesorhizobium albiziae]SFJ93584.1 hypothetical protein SAMN04488498_101393 [Mesorhizobium albiziae]
MTDKTTKKTTTKTKKPAANKPAAAKKEAGPTKKGTVLEMLKAEGGTTIEAIVAKLSVSNIAARSLIGDVRRMGVAVARVDEGGKPTTFTAA